MSTEKTNEELVRLICSGVDVNANLEQLWKQMERLVYKISKQYQSETDDLMQEGFLGMVRAVELYNEAEGIPFANYAAKWIRAFMSKYAAGDKVVKLPVNDYYLSRKMLKVISEYKKQENRQPTRLELCHRLDITLGDLKRVEYMVNMDTSASLNKQASEESDDIIEDLLQDFSTNVEENALDKVQNEQLKATIWSLVDSLNEKQAVTLRARYQENLTLKECGERLGVTLESARRYQENGLKELGKPSKARQLKPFLYDRIESISLHGSVSSFKHTGSSSTERVILKMEEWKERRNGTIK